ncbi:MAG: hypothetical protein EXR80_02485 [Methylococcales bacterium]|nr:hypothetical protein [Methylococcales bacterium]
MANLDGILKMPAIVGVKMDNMDKPPDWQQPFPIRLGIIADDEPDLQPISYRFQLKKITHYWVMSLFTPVMPLFSSRLNTTFYTL